MDYESKVSPVIFDTWASQPEDCCINLRAGRGSLPDEHENDHHIHPLTTLALAPHAIALELLVSSFDGDEILRYDGLTGDFIDVLASAGGLNGPAGMQFGPDGNLYVGGFNSNQVHRFDGATGEFIDIFASGSGLDGIEGILFGPDGNLYVANFRTDTVLRFNGTTVAFMEVFASGGGLNVPANPVFCTTSGVRITAGMNDAWFNAATAGQGLFVTVFPDLRAMFIAMFTYDTERPPANVTAVLGEPGHRWFTAFGPFLGYVAILDVELTEGGIFNSASPSPVQTPNYGTVTVIFIDCNALILSYEFPMLGLSGEIPMTRIAGDNIARCEQLAVQ